MDIFDVIIALCTFIAFVCYRYIYDEKSVLVWEYLLPIIGIVGFIFIFNGGLYMPARNIIFIFLIIGGIFMLIDYCAYLFLKCVRYFKERKDD